jgi:hypothetical protein
MNQVDCIVANQWRKFVGKPLKFGLSRGHPIGRGLQPYQCTDLICLALLLLRRRWAQPGKDYCIAACNHTLRQDKGVLPNPAGGVDSHEYAAGLTL